MPEVPCACGTFARLRRTEAAAIASTTPVSQWVNRMGLQRPEAKDRLREADREEPGGGESSQRLPYLAILALLALAGLYFYANGRGSSSGAEVISLFNLEKAADSEAHSTFHLFLS